MLLTREQIFLVVCMGLAVLFSNRGTSVRADDGDDDEAEPDSVTRPSCRVYLHRCPPHLNRGEVCGSDGRTYPSHCRLLYTACRRHNRLRGHGVGLSLVHPGPCIDDAHYDIRNQTGNCGSPCPPERAIVCGDDGQTYQSKCLLDHAACTDQHPILVAHTGPCRPEQHDASAAVDPGAGAPAGGGTVWDVQNTGADPAADAAPHAADGEQGEYSGRQEGEESNDEEEEEDEEGEEDDEEEEDHDDDSEEDSEEEEESEEHPLDPVTHTPTVSATVSTAPAFTRTTEPFQTASVSPSLPMQPGPTPTGHIPGPTDLPPGPTTVPPTCAPSCPLDNSNPVCGTDGETYGSLCLLEAHACQTGDRSLIVLYDGPCIEPDVIVPLPRRDPTTLASHRVTEPPTTTAGLPVRERLTYCPDETECSLLYLPVCGSDDVTYLSWCHLRLEACGEKGEALTVSHMGECVDDTAGCEATCPDLYEPICDSDNMTYYSPCSMRRIACLRHEDLPEILHSGECPLTPLVCPESCPGINDPVCGSDGNSYPSLCVIRLVACRSTEDKFLRTAYRGLCINEPCQRSCPVREYAPLCGSNGKTYQNECFLWMEMCRKPDLVRFDKDCNLAIP